nr:HNH endonuclease family protein [Nocardioides sp. MAH-18]
MRHAGLAGLLLLAGCSTLEAPAEPDPVAPAPTLSAVRATRLLDDLPRAPRAWGGPSYDRDAFGTPWADTDGNGCNQRDDVLLRDAVTGSTTVAQQGGCGHDVLAGEWLDPYTGRDLALDDLKDPGQAQAVQIDHVVPLAEAWRSGAAGWSAARRRSFANDLPGLLAVDGPTNAAKSDDDPAAWRPRAAYQCAYATRWIAVKSAWSLAVDPSEVAALEDMLGRC